MIFRSDSQKSDPVASWHRPDRAFFAGGACHILSHVFLQEYPRSGYRPAYILPRQGFRGSHVIVSDGEMVFDYHGYCDHERYLGRYFTKMRRRFPGWEADVLSIEGSPVGRDFCSRFNHRLPSQFFSDPLPRAKKFLARFSPPHYSRHD
jgi:hypothetical protein